MPRSFSIILAAIIAGGALTGCQEYRTTGTFTQQSAPGASLSPPQGNCSDFTIDSPNASSLESVAKEPVASFVAATPELSILNSILKQPNITEELLRFPALTFFAPTNRAFDKISKAQLSALQKSPDKAMRALAKHLVKRRLSLEDLPGTHPTLGRSELAVSNDGGSTAIDGTATVVCANIQTANATVHIIDAVLDTT